MGQYKKKSSNFFKLRRKAVRNINKNGEIIIKINKNKSCFKIKGQF